MCAYISIYIYIFHGFPWFSMVFGYIPVGFPWFSIFMLVFIVWVYIYVYIYIYKIRSVTSVTSWTHEAHLSPQIMIHDETLVGESSLETGRISGW